MVLFMPESPRHLMNVGREDECLQVLGRLRGKSVEDLGVRVEFLEIKAMKEFEVATARKKYPIYQDGTRKSAFMIQMNDYASLVTNRSLLKRTGIAVFIMVFQQW